MALYLKNLLKSRNKLKEDDDYETINLCESEKPYILTEVYYLLVIIFIGLPMWYLTCSSSKYSLPQADISITRPRLHLDISVVRLPSAGHMGSVDDSDYNDRLRSKLQSELGELELGDISHVSDWRVRRPTPDENRFLKSLLELNLPKRILLKRFEQGLHELHKQSYRFRLLIFLLDQNLCDESQTYVFGSMPFIYVCPTKDADLVHEIGTALKSTYLGTVDMTQLKRVASSKTNLLITLVPQIVDSKREKLYDLADKFHETYLKEVKRKYVELPEIINIRFITQVLYDFQFDTKKKSIRNFQDVEDIFRRFRSRVDDPLEDDVHHVAVIIPEKENTTSILNGLVETPDSHFLLELKDHTSIFSSLRAIVRRVVGLKSTKLCENCLIDTDVFINKWELDVLVSYLTVLKLRSIYLSIESLGKLKHIPKQVSMWTNEAYRHSLNSVNLLELRKPLEAYRSASVGYEMSEKAYYDPALVDSSNEFPDENKYAIYLPLFLPLAIPILMSIVRVLKYFLASKGSKGPEEKQKVH